MKKRIFALITMAAFLLTLATGFFGSNVTEAKNTNPILNIAKDQLRIQNPIKDQTKLQKNDGSCQDTAAILVADGKDQTRDRLQDPDKLQKHDGSCQVSTV